MTPCKLLSQNDTVKLTIETTKLIIQELIELDRLEAIEDDYLLCDSVIGSQDSLIAQQQLLITEHELFGEDLKGKNKALSIGLEEEKKRVKRTKNVLKIVAVLAAVLALR